VVKERIGGIIQARMGSTRLPGKMLIDITGKPLIQHVIDRVSQSKRIEKLILATTDNPRDAVLVDFAKENLLDFFIGSEKDVLDRFYQAAKTFNIKIIVRITPDDPFKDPEVIDKAVEIFLNGKGELDYVTNTLPPTYPIGLDIEVFSFYALEKAWKEAKKTSEREHVTPYIWKHPEIFRIKNFGLEKDLSYLRWTLDDDRDSQFTREVYQRLYPKKRFFLMEDILELLNLYPALVKINEREEKYEGYLKSLEKDRLEEMKKRVMPREDLNE
jgi:spore coat polysaccharide biosynthesis protein SpsF (cytidylyltransferase family)